MNYLVLGCNGMAGHMIAQFLLEKGHRVTGFAREKSTMVNTIVGTAEDTSLIKRVIDEGKYDAVINCIGILNQFAEEKKGKAVFLNSYLPHFLADITSNSDTQIVHLSTDCVFSGERGRYKETDFRDGRTFYDRTKALGELEDDKNLTLRQSIVGPDIKETGIGLLNWFMKQNSSINGYTRAIWTGQTTLQLAKTIEVATSNKIHGLFNMVPNCSITKYELLQLFNHYLRDDKLEIKPVEGVIADKSLIRTRFEFDYEIPDYEIMVKDLASWINKHKEIYPHYFKEF